MNIQSLSPAVGAKTKSVRVGRGIGSGIGKTSGKGHKGQNARSGGGVRPGFEGGQIPLVRRTKIRGFNNKEFAKVYSIVNLADLAEFPAKTVITEEFLYERRIIGKMEPNGLKVLGSGEMKNALTVKAAKFSESAKEKIEKAGGKAEII